MARRKESVPRCLGQEENGRRCPERYRAQKGWDFFAWGPVRGWLCPRCRATLADLLAGPGLPEPAGALDALVEGAIQRGKKMLSDLISPVSGGGETSKDDFMKGFPDVEAGL